MLLRLNSSFCYKKKKLIDYGIAVTAWNYHLNCNLNLYNVFGLQTTFLFLHSFPSVISLLYLTLDIVVALEYISVAFSQAMIGRSMFFIVFFFSPFFFLWSPDQHKAEKPDSILPWTHQTKRWCQKLLQKFHQSPQKPPVAIHLWLKSLTLLIIGVKMT